MYTITSTTDHKYIGMTFNDVSKTITFPDGFIMYVAFIKIEGDFVTISNDNYTITFKEEE